MDIDITFELGRRLLQVLGVSLELRFVTKAR